MASALDELIAGKGAPAAPVSNSSNLDALISGKTSASPISPTLAPMASAPAPASTTPLAPVSSGYGAAAGQDTSGKSYATVPMTIPKTFMSPETTVSQVDKTRVAPPVDPTKPQVITKGLLQNGRMPESASQQIKASIGGKASEELDHIMPLELGGSNADSNLQLEHFISGTKNTATDPLENQIAHEAYTGQISLVDAWRKMAKAKGITLTEDKAKNGPVDNYLLNHPNTLIPLANAQNAITGAAGKVGGFVKGLFTNPIGTIKNTFSNKNADKVFNELGGQAIVHPLQTVNNIVKQASNSAESTLSNLAHSAAQVTEDFKGNRSAADKTKSVLNLLTAAAATAFYPVSETFEIASQLPVIKPAADAVGILFDKTGKIGGFAASALLDSLPISDDWKEKLQIPIETVGTLVGQVALGGKIYADITGGMDVKEAEVSAKAQAKDLNTANAWRQLGNPKDMAEAEANYRAMAHGAHPDVQGGSHEAMSSLNQAIQTLRENGFPSEKIQGMAPEKSEPIQPKPIAQIGESDSKTPELDKLINPLQETDRAGNSLERNDKGRVMRVVGKDGEIIYDADKVKKEIAAPSKPELSPSGLTLGSQNYMDSFNKAEGQKTISNKNGTDFVLGDFGKSHFAAKTGEGKTDRLSESELKPTVENIKQVFNGSRDTTSHRSNTAAWISEMPNGEKRILYTKLNRFGQEEITSAHKVYEKGNPNYLTDLAKNGIPPGNRTQMTRLEEGRPIRLNEGDNKSLAQGQKEVKLRETYAAHPKAQEELQNLLNQIDASQKGTRYTIPAPTDTVGERSFGSTPSTFPSWVREDLRKTKLFNAVFGGLRNIGDIKYPPAKNVAQRALYEDLLDELDRNLGVSTKEVRNGIMEANGTTPNKTTKTGDSGIGGSESGSGEIKPEEVFPEKTGVAAPKAKPRESVVLSSGSDFGIGQFIVEDVKPAVRGAGEGFIKFLKETQHLLSPKAGASAKSLDIVFQMKGARDKAEAMLDLTTQKIEKSFDKMSEKDQIAFIDRVKRGEAQPTKELQAVADFIRNVDDTTYREVQEYKPAAAWKENHYRVLWKTVPGQPEAKGFKGLFRKPLQGSKGFLKRATLVDMSEGLAKGGVPYSYNPITIFKMAYADQMHFITAQRMWAAFKANGLAKFVKTGGQAPDGFVRLNDTIAKVYFKADTEGGGSVLATSGEWFVEENIGRVMNNFLSVDKIRASALGRGMMAVKNATTAVELSLSAFHFTFETIEAASSKMALGIRESYNIGLLQKNPAMFLKGISDIVTSFASPKSTFTTGRRFLSMVRNAEEFKKSKDGQKFLKQFPGAEGYIDDFFNGGGKLKMAKDYEINMQKAFMQNIASGNYIGATLRAVPAALKVMMKPLFDTYIPALKMGMFMQEFPVRLQEKTNDLANGKVTRTQLARETIDFIDNRLGEMNFDNLMWNRTFKTGMQFFFRSVTWKLGNIRAFGNNALLEQAREFQAAWREGRAPQISTGMAWVFSLAIYTALISTILMKLLTGKYPTQWKDLVYPQSDPNDPSKRLSVATYMKDGFSAAHSPVNYVLSSTSGEIGRMIDVWNNRDFYGTEIYNSSDPFYAKALAAALHTVPVPFSISSFQQSKTTKEKTLGFFGFTQAPSYITKDPLQQKISALYQTRFGGGTQTQEATDAAKAKTAIRNAYYGNDDAQANALLQEAIKKGYITEKGAKAFIGDSDKPGDVRAFSRFSDTDQENLLQDMTVDQLDRYAWEANTAIKDRLGDLSANAKKFVGLVKSGELKKPVWKRGEMQTTQ